MSFGQGIGDAFASLMWLAGCAVVLGAVSFVGCVGMLIYLLCR